MPGTALGKAPTGLVGSTFLLKASAPAVSPPSGMPPPHAYFSSSTPEVRGQRPPKVWIGP